MTKLNIIKNDVHISELSETSVKMLESVVDRYELDDTVYLFETIHGQSVNISRKSGRFVPGSNGQAARLDGEDASFFLSLPGLRWFECYTDNIQIGFDNRATQN